MFPGIFSIAYTRCPPFAPLSAVGKKAETWIFREEWVKRGEWICSGMAEDFLQIIFNCHSNITWHRKMSMIIIIMSFTSLQFLENFLQFPHVLCKHNIRFFGSSLLEKAKSCYWIIIFLCRVINMKFYWSIAAFLFF